MHENKKQQLKHNQNVPLGEKEQSCKQSEEREKLPQLQTEV